MLKVTDRKSSKTNLDSRVKIMVDKICMLWDEMQDFERVFKHGLTQMSQSNHIRPEFAYKLVRNDANTIEVWHVSLEEQIQDRLLCKVKYIQD